MLARQVYPEALRSARVVLREEVRQQGKLHMRLVQRAKGATTVLPRSAWTPAAGTSIASHKDPLAATFCNLLTIDASDTVEEVIDRDTEELGRWLRCVDAGLLL